jgi:hypothetical protein
MDAFVHEKEIYPRVKGNHVGRKLERRCGPFNRIIGMCKDQYELFVFHGSLLGIFMTLG